MLLRKALADSARRALRASGFRAVTRTIRGAPVRIPVAMGKLESLLFNPAYCPFFNEDDVMDVLAAKSRPDDVVFDVGAYHGVWAVLLARYAREVVAFEPCAGTFGVLEETLAVNNARNVTAYPIAIANESCIADFWGEAVPAFGKAIRAAYIAVSPLTRSTTSCRRERRFRT
jgi:hypothetical protein